MTGGSHCLRPTRRPITATLTGQLEPWLAAAGHVVSRPWVDFMTSWVVLRHSL